MHWDVSVRGTEKYLGRLYDRHISHACGILTEQVLITSANVLPAGQDTQGLGRSGALHKAAVANIPSRMLASAIGIVADERVDNQNR